MRLSLIVLWALVGWCGNEPLVLVLRRRWWPIPPTPGPDPWPILFLPRIIGVVGGVIGGWVFTVVFGPGPQPWLTAGPDLSPGYRLSPPPPQRWEPLSVGVC